jgi:hypothetical protein
MLARAGLMEPGCIEDAKLPVESWLKYVIDPQAEIGQDSPFYHCILPSAHGLEHGQFQLFALLPPLTHRDRWHELTPHLDRPGLAKICAGCRSRCFRVELSVYRPRRLCIGIVSSV